jgi:hypothetical protein
MPNKVWSAKRERQYRHVKDSLLARGDSAPLEQALRH